MEPYFPIFISLSGKKAVVIGAGAIACRRVKSLLPFGAEITVIAPEACGELDLLAKEGRIRLERRPYAPGDLSGAVIAVSAANDRAVNHGAFLEAKAAGIPISVADCKEESTFYFPGIAREGEVVAGVTASGSDHKLAKEAAAAVRECLRNFVESRESHGKTDHPGREPGKRPGSSPDETGAESN